VATWKKRTYKLEQNHKWKAKPGCQIFVADRGAVRFDFPHGWVSVPNMEAGSIKLCDKEPPDDDCTLEVSIQYLAMIDWSDLSLGYLLGELDGGPEMRGPVLSKSEIVEEKRGDLEIAWRSMRWIDPSQNREARSYTCLARRDFTQALITFDHWVDDEDRLANVFPIVLETLDVGRQPPGIRSRP
jgi:hypothetical protein